MNRTTVQIVQQPSKVIYVAKTGVQELNLTAQGVLELSRSVLEQGGSVSDRCQMWMMQDGRMASKRTTVIVEKGAKAPLSL
ncbi:MAG TPA: hypothetical protein VJP79_08815 [Nitrososphaera sp.]|nr:hypothetical protein [Nitrososphaera sp.]